MTLSEWLTILAIVTGPFLAVFIQRKIDIERERRGTKLWIFKTLMATRASSFDPAHVDALNRIDLEFSNRGQDAEVKTAWKEYLDHLATNFTGGPTEAELTNWSDKRQELLADLLVKMGKSLRYEFDRVYIKKSIYWPRGFVDQGQELEQIRKLLAEILRGDRNFPIVASVPQSEDDEKFVKAYRKGILDVIIGNKPVRVSVADERRDAPSSDAL